MRMLSVYWSFCTGLYKDYSIRLQLARHLCKAYTIPLMATRDMKKWHRATAVLQDALSTCRSQQKRNRRGEWLCLLDLIYLHCKFGKPKSAKKIFGNLKELTLCMKASQSYVHGLSAKDFEDKGKLVTHCRGPYPRSSGRPCERFEKNQTLPKRSRCISSR